VVLSRRYGEPVSDQTPGVPPTPLPPTHQSTYDSPSYESPGYQATTYPSPTHETLTTLTPPPRRSSGVVAMLGLVLAAVVVLAGAGAGVWALSEWVGEQQGADGPGGPGGPVAVDDPAARPLAPLISPTGFEQLLDALEKETGSTSVVDLTLYPGYAVAVVPVPGGKGRTARLYYDGSFREQGLGTSDDATLDLRRVDPELLVSLSRKARNAVEDPNSWYLIIGAPDTQGAAIYAYASNKYGEGGYVAADLKGRVVNRVGW
jgi:hypothetical protein